MYNYIYTMCMCRTKKEMLTDYNAINISFNYGDINNVLSNESFHRN